MGKEIDAAIALRLKAAKNVLLVSHVRPDGDAVGSLLALGLALEQAGKSVQMVLHDGLPKRYRWLQGSERIVREATGDFDLVGCIDCSDIHRMGEALRDYPVIHLNIDHHVTNQNFAELNCVVPEAVATSEILCERIPLWNLSIDGPVASALLYGIVSDTLGFRTSNMSSKALRLAADLMDKGAPLPEIYNQALLLQTFPALRFWGAGLNRLKAFDGILWTSLALSDRQVAEYPGKDDADLINILSAVEGYSVAVIFVEQPDGQVKVSWRSQPGIDVSQIALHFGGGGHSAAAGAEIVGRLDEVQERVLKKTQEMVNLG